MWLTAACSTRPGATCGPLMINGTPTDSAYMVLTRPALSDERVQLNAAGQVELKLKTPWRDGTTHLVMSPLEFMQRLAALARGRGAPDPVPWGDDPERQAAGAGGAAGAGAEC